MDVETSDALERLGSRVDRLEGSFRGELTELRMELRTEVTGLRMELRGGMTELRGEMGELRDQMGGLRGEVGELRGEVGELRGEVGELRGDMIVFREDLRKELRDGLESNWTRTQVLFEALREDVQMLAGHVADLASRKPRS